MSERIAIFPFDEDSIYLLSNIEKMETYKIVYAVTPKGWDNLKGMEISNSDLLFSEDEFSHNECIQNIDALLLIESNYMTDKNGLSNMINLANRKGKKVMRLSDIEDKSEREFAEFWEKSQSEKDNIVPIDVPVIMVAGLGEACEKMELETQVYNYIQKQGYKVSIITSNQLGKLFDFHTIPSFIYSNELGFSQQVSKFNSFVYNIVQKEESDVIIIGIPGAPAIYSKDYPNGYGYIPFLISNAVTPDVCILSLYCGEYSNQYINEIKSMFFYRFGIKIGYLHISKKVFKYNFENRKMDYFALDDLERIREIVDLQTTLPTFNISDKKSSEIVFNGILSELQNNIEIL